MRIKSDLRALYNYQRDFQVKIPEDQVGRGCFMEMRLGKTLATIRDVKRLSRKVPLKTGLVALPGHAIEAWQNDLEADNEAWERAYFLDRHHRLQAIHRAFTADRRTWCLINYESLIRTPEIATLDWDFVVADESAKLRHPFSKTSVYFQIGFRAARYRYALSGDPAPGGPRDLWAQFKFLDGEFMGCGKYWDFWWRFWERDGEHDWHLRHGAWEKIKAELHRRAYVLRRVNVNVGSKKHWTPAYVDMHPDQRKMYNQIYDEFCAKLDDGSTMETMWATARIMWMHRICGGFSPDGLDPYWNTKITYLQSQFEGELSHQQVVISCRFKAEVPYVVRNLNAIGIAAAGFNGDTPFEKRGEFVREFRSGRYQVLVVTPDTARYSYDLSVASIMIFYSGSHNGEFRTQIEDRLILPTKKDPVGYIDLMCRNSYDEDVMKCAMGRTFQSRLLTTKLKGEMLDIW